MSKDGSKWSGAWIRSEKMEGEGGVLSKNRPSSIFLQWVTATVVANVPNEDTPLMIDLDNGEVDESNINTIFALPHEGVSGVSNEAQIMQEKFRFKPLIRGVTEIPIRGDQVVVCHLAGVNYYMGPLNTTNGVNHNEDTIGIPFTPIPHGNVTEGSNGDAIRDRNFEYRSQRKLNKKSKITLDSMEGSEKIILKNPSSGEEYVSSQHGDMILEGRHGNSIRIGSRSGASYMFLSNDRNPENDAESWLDGTMIAMTTIGNLEEHLGGINEATKTALSEDASDDAATPEHRQYHFDSYSEIDNFSDRKISDVMKVVFTDLEPSDLLSAEPSLYTQTYDHNHLFLGSQGRITLNAKDSIVLSTQNFLNIGSKKYLTISAGKDTILESTNIYLGKAAVTDRNPMVLGNELVKILKDLIGVIKTAASNFYFAPVPLVDNNMIPIATKAGPGSLGDIEQRLNTILSEFHFIENNTGEDKISIDPPESE